jgi:AmiR/NasT family two-component response regulator
MWERTRRAAEAARVARDRAEATARIESLVAELDRTVHELDGLRTAMRTRAAIEQAKGVIMGLHGCSEAAAFATLVRLSQSSQHRVHDVAALIVTQVADGDDGRQAVIDLTRASIPADE